MTNPLPSEGAADEAAVLKARAALLARRADDTSETRTVAVIPFIVGGQAYGVPALDVREVRRIHAMARLPQAPRGLLGVTRVRSSVVAVFDVPQLLNLATETSAADPEWVIVLESGGRSPLGLAVEVVDGVQQQAIDDIVSPVTGQVPGSLGITPQGTIVLDSDALLDAPPMFASPTIVGEFQPPSPAPDGARQEGTP